MERLTTRKLLDCATLKSVFDVQTIDYWDENGDAKSAKSGPAVDRLSAYEDTGMEPEEIKDFVSRWKEAIELAVLCKEAGIDRLRDLLDAEKELEAMK